MPKHNSDINEDQFQGYTSPNYTQVPDELFDYQLPDLSGAELKVLLYIMRRTFGFKKDADNISLNQICNGITTRDGRVLDRGTGLSKSTAQLAIKGLLKKNIILTTKRVSREKGNEATTFELNVPSRRPYTENRHRGAMPEIDTALYRKSAQQETVLQDTDLSKVRMAQATKSRKNRPKSGFASNNIASDQSDSESIRDGEGGDGSSRADVVAGAAANVPSRHLTLLSSQPTVTSDSVTSGGPSPEPSRHNGEFQSIAELLPKMRGRPPGTRDQRDLVTSYLKDFRPFLGDEAPLWNSVSRAINIFKKGHIPIERWPDLLLEANSITKSNTQHIQRKPGESGSGFAAKNRAPYYFAVLEDLCGLRDEDDAAVSSTP